mgnify:CR=1 FL=1
MNVLIWAARVSEIMNLDAFNACGFCAPVHLVVQICLGDEKDAVIGFQSVQGLDVILHLIYEKLWDFDRSVALGRFLGSVMMTLPLMLCRNLLMVSTSSSPKCTQYLEDVGGSWLVHHLLVRILPRVVDDLGGILLQKVVANHMVENA